MTEKRKAPAGTGARGTNLNRLRENSASAPANASAATRFGITEEALSEIRASVIECLEHDVRALAAHQRPLSGVLVFSRSRKTSRPAANRDWARHFGLALRPIWLNAFNSYVKLLTSTIIAHAPDGRAADWKTIFDDAVQFCTALEESDRCATWYMLAFGRAGKSGDQPSADEYGAFREALSLWRNRYSWPDQRRLEDRAERMVRHIVRIDPEKTAGNTIQLPTIAEFRRMGIITQKQAATWLHCTTRTIRTYIKNSQLSKTNTGKVCCDDKWARKLRLQYGPTLRAM